MAKKHFQHRSKKHKDDSVLSDHDIEKLLEKARDGIEDDVDLSIEDYIAHVNKSLIPLLVKTLTASRNPEAAYTAWRNFHSTGNLVELRQELNSWRPLPSGLFNMTNSMMRLEQKQDGHGALLRKSAQRNLQAGFRTAAATRQAHADKKNNTRGALDAQQEAAFDILIYIWRMYQGPSAQIHPLRAAIAPHMEKALEKRFFSNFDLLKKEARNPIIDESIIRGLRQDVLAASQERFEKLAEESYTRSPEAIIPDYGFSIKQMPESTKFGIEIEGFSAIKETFPKNLTALEGLLQKAGLEASAALKAKHTDYSDWTITYDNSIINPLEINGRYKTPHAITHNSSSFELVSPILNGTDGQKQLTTAIGVLNDIKFKSNDTCGLHMHISLEETTLEEKKNLVKALYNNREALDKLVHHERRGDKNKFALAIDDIEIDKVDDAKDIGELVNIINPGYNRNSKFDMTGLVGGGPPTIQYRCAGGPNYLASTADYAVILANFTEQALDNPDVTVANVIKGLEAQRDALQKKQTHSTKRGPAPN